MNNISRGVFITSLLFTSLAHSQGLYTNFSKLIKGQKTKYNKIANTLLNQDFSLDDTQDINKVRIDPNFLNLIIQNSPTRYILLATNDRCSLYDLMQTNLLRSPEGELNYVIVNYLDKQNTKQKRVLTKEKFLKLVAHKQCPQVRKFREYFETQNARKTLQDTKLIPPTSKDECYNLFENFRKDLKTPYLCNIMEQIRETKKNRVKLNNLSKTDYKARAKYKKRIERAASYNKILSKKAKELLYGLCLNVHTPQNFCYQYFTKSFWTQSFSQDPNSPILKSFCKGFNKKKCINTLNGSPKFCHYGGKRYPGLVPKPSCPEISRALLKSNTNKLQNDCPGKVGSEAVTALGRVINLTKDHTKEEFACETNSTLPVAKFSGEFTDYDSWKTNLCFINKLDSNNKVCYPTIYGKADKEDVSLDRNVKKILERTKGFKEGKCNIISKKSYKPSLLKFRSGCHIVMDKFPCTGVDCKIKVILDERHQTQILQENVIDFNLFPYDYINENKALIKVLSKEYKVNLKSVKNMSTFLFVKKNHPKANFIGVGCREDLLPTFFERSNFNQCHPLPFTVDGHFEENGSYALVTRTALDQIHAPRIIPWPYIFTAIKNYQQLHPIKLWGFYAFY